MRRILIPGAVALLVLGGCGDAGVFTEPLVTGPTQAIVDSEHGDGNPHFAFVGPTVEEPEGGFDGIFDKWLLPRVEICLLGQGGCVAPVVTIFSEESRASERVRLSEGGEKYYTTWHTGDFGLDPAEFYRIEVWVGDTRLGYADVDVYETGRERRGIDESLYIPVKNGRSLQVAFRIEHGALCADLEPGCNQITVDNDGGTLVVRTLEGGQEIVVGGLAIPPAALPPGVEQVTVTGRLVDPTDLGPDFYLSDALFPYGLQLEIDPDISFEQLMTVTVCQSEELEDPLSPVFLDPALHDALRIFRQDGSVWSILALAGAAVPPAAPCGDPVQVGASPGFLGGLGGALGRLARSLAPEPLRAGALVHGGLSSLIGDASEYFAILPPTPFPGVVSLWWGEQGTADAVGDNDLTATGQQGIDWGIDQGVDEFGVALYFAASGAYMDRIPTPDIDGLQAFSLSGWVRPEPGYEDRIQRFVTLLGGKAGIRQDGTQVPSGLRFSAGIGGSTVELAAGALTPGCYNHVAGTYDGSVMRLYLNGSLVASTAVAGSSATGTGVRLSGTVPQTTPGGGDAMVGALDAAAVHDRALLASEIQETWDRAGALKCP